MKQVKINPSYYVMLQQIAKRRRAKIDEALEDIIARYYNSKLPKLIKSTIRFVLIMIITTGQFVFIEIHLQAISQVRFQIL